MSDYFFVKLKNRGLLHVEGAEARDFLQGLITADMDKLAPAAPLYACLLTPQGKFLHDFFVIDGGDFILLDCESCARAQNLFSRLIKYRLRRDVQISVEENHTAYSILLSRPSESEWRDFKSLGFARDDMFLDIRHIDMGIRSFEKPHLPEKPFEEWDTRRIALTIPDGSRDLIPEKSTMDEARMDVLGAIDYKKGCYVGQELTARMHYRGLGKKHLYTVSLADLPEGAELRSSCGDIGIALMKDKNIKF